MPASRSRTRVVFSVVAFTMATIALASQGASSARAAVDLLPDIIIRESDLYDHDVVTSIEPGRTHLRLSNGTPNIGDGKLHLYGVEPGYPDGTQDVMQRVFADDGSFFDRAAGRFIYHPTHNHIHLESWCIYRLKQVLPGGGVGDKVAEGAKTSFCVLDLSVYDSSLPNFDPDGEYHSCGTTIQGLSVGWADVYSKGLSGQNIDITGVPDGTYWLESEADPDNHILEKDELNNITRIQVVIGAPAPINPDAYEPNATQLAVDGRPEGGINSPNLGPCGPRRVVSGLSIDQTGDEDYYKFYVNELGGSGDFVSTSFVHGLGDVDMRLYNAAGAQVGSSTGTGNSEQITLQGRAEGWYYLRVYGYGGDTNPSYELTVDPSQNGAPAITVLDPPEGDVDVEHGVENYTVTWSIAEPEGDLTWVSLYVNATPTLDGNEILLPTPMNTPGAQGFAAINSAELEPGTYWVYCSITDGGTVTGGWSAGTISFFETSTAVPPTPSAGPAATRVLPAYPNPFNPSTTLRLELAQAGHVAWRVYDARGGLVRTLLDGELAAGRYVRSWDGADAAGQPVASGVYYAVVDAPRRVSQQKLLLLK